MLQSQEPKVNNQILTKKIRKKQQKHRKKYFNPGRTYNKCYTGITKYDERIHGKNGRNV